MSLVRPPSRPGLLAGIALLLVARSALAEKAVADTNKLARNGDWSAAVNAWKAVLAADAYDPAAAFNIGVGHEVIGDLVGARTWYPKAAATKPAKEIDRALQRVAPPRAAKRSTKP